MATSNYMDNDINPNQLKNHHLITQNLMNQAHFSLNDVQIQWDMNRGTIQVLGVDSVLFWTDPSLLYLFTPMVEEMGIDLFRLLVASSSIKGTNKDYEVMVTELADNFVDGFTAWTNIVCSSGWGKFTLLEYESERCHAVIQVDNPWELTTQQILPHEKRWDCPFLQGKIIGIFEKACEQNCWATDHYEVLESGDFRARFTIYSSQKTIDNELNNLRKKKLTQHEKALQAEIDEKTAKLKKSNEILENIANLDFLTNLNNRRSLENKLAEIKEDQRWDDHILIFIDLDQFKVINDTCGHLAGDRLLTVVGERLIDCIDRSDHFISRYGGDEFTILLNSPDIHSVINLANKIRKSIIDTRFEWDGKVYQINCSIGLTPLNTIEPVGDNAIIAADNACYQAKKWPQPNLHFRKSQSARRKSTYRNELGTSHQRGHCQ